MWLSLSIKSVSRLFLLDFKKFGEVERVCIYLCVCIAIISSVKDVEKDTYQSLKALLVAPRGPAASYTSMRESYRATNVFIPRETNSYRKKLTIAAFIQCV